MPFKKIGRMMATLILTVSILLSVTVGSSAFAVYNFSSEHEIYIVFTPNECSGFSLIPGVLCTELITINPDTTWSSNNRAGSIVIGTTFNVIAKEQRSGRSFYGSGGGGRVTLEVDRQGWVEVRPEYYSDVNKLQAVKFDVFDQSGKRMKDVRIRVQD